MGLKGRHLPHLGGWVEKLPLTPVRTALLFIVKCIPTRKQQKQVHNGRPSPTEKKQAR
jgi:hypothetical protein